MKYEIFIKINGQLTKGSTQVFPGAPITVQGLSSTLFGCASFLALGPGWFWRFMGDHTCLGQLVFEVLIVPKDVKYAYVHMAVIKDLHAVNKTVGVIQTAGENAFLTHEGFDFAGSQALCEGILCDFVHEEGILCLKPGYALEGRKIALYAFQAGKHDLRS